MYNSTPPSPEVENFQMKIYYPTGDRTPDLLNQRQACYHLNQRGELNIRMLWDGNRIKPRTKAVAAFRLETGHDCLAKHLHWFNILSSDNCMLCRLPDTVMDSHHLTQCAALKENESRDMTALYWDTRRRMVLTPPTLCHWKRRDSIMDEYWILDNWLEHQHKTGDPGTNPRTG